VTTPDVQVPFFLEGLESVVVAHWVELERGRDQNQRTVAFFERAGRAVEEAIEI